CRSVVHLFPRRRLLVRVRRSDHLEVALHRLPVAEWNRLAVDDGLGLLLELLEALLVLAAPPFAGLPRPGRLHVGVPLAAGRAGDLQFVALAVEPRLLAVDVAADGPAPATRRAVGLLRRLHPCPTVALALAVLQFLHLGVQQVVDLL